jgi:hypothetical protein
MIDVCAIFVASIGVPGCIVVHRFTADIDRTIAAATGKVSDGQTCVAGVCGTKGLCAVANLESREAEYSSKHERQSHYEDERPHFVL